MTTDIVINNIINELCQKFNVAASELVPRLQAYGMAMNRFGAITAGVICIALLIATVVVCKIDSDLAEIASIFTIIGIIISIFILIYDIYMYIGWKYAPEIKSIEYVMYLFKK